MTVSYDIPTRTLTLVLTPREHKILTWVKKKYSDKGFTDYVDAFFNIKEDEARSSVQTQIITLNLMADPDVIALLRQKGIDI